jgi:predicted ATPase
VRLFQGLCQTDLRTVMAAPVLLQDTLRQARDRGVTVLSGAADSIETSTPYFAFRPVFAALLRLEAMPAGPAGRQTFVLNPLPSSPEVLRLAPLLGTVSMGNAIFWIGDLMTARDQMQQAIDLYAEDRDRSLAFLFGQDPDVANRGMQAWPLALMGQTEEALRRGEEAIARARALTHPYTLGYALVHDGCCHQFLQRTEATLQRAEEIIPLASEKFFPNWLLVGMALKGWALGLRRNVAEGQELLAQAVGLWRSFGSELAVPYLLTLWAEVSCLAGRTEEGLKMLTEALAAGERNNDRWYEAETYRLQGACLRRLGKCAESEAALRHATQVAERQDAVLFARRAATDLAELLAASPTGGTVPGSPAMVSR